MEQIQYMQEDIDTALKEINTQMEDDCLVTLKITTMTLLIRSLIGTINLCKFIEWCDENESYLNKLVKKRTAGFYNCVIFKNNNVSIKLFQNGNIHITGVKSISEGYKNSQVLIDIIKAYRNHVVSKVEMNMDVPFKIDVQLINGCLKLCIEDGEVLCLRSMYELLYKQYPELIVIFDNEHHPGLRVKFPYKEKMPTLIIFKSGSILVNAFRKGDDLLKVYSVLLIWIQNNYKKCMKQVSVEMKKKKRKLDFDYSEIANL